MDQLLTDFREFIREEGLFTPDQRLLVAVSGGLDSSVLVHLCFSLKLDISLAHCNFRLRGAESDRDEQHCRELAAGYGLPLYVRQFDTASYASAQKLSIQEAARELRYEWFRELAEGNGFHKILTAHHADDNVETMLMNLFRGTGISGLRGMPVLAGKIARPLLFASRQDLEIYASRQQLSFVEDSSNLTDKYTRNFFRHRILPLVAEMIPGAMANCREGVQRFREVEMVYRKAINKTLEGLVTRRGEEIHVPVEKLRRMKPLRTLVFELFSTAGFSSPQVDEILNLMDAETGRYLSSSSHRLLKNRNWLILSPHSTTPSGIVLIEQPGDTANLPEGSVITSKVPSSSGEFPPDPSIAWFDASAIEFPVILRRWKAGDYFYPLGMAKKKKLARFLIDIKLSRIEKEKVWVAESAGRIIWVVGHRIDHRVRVKPSTNMILVMKLIS